MKYLLVTTAIISALISFDTMAQDAASRPIHQLDKAVPAGTNVQAPAQQQYKEGEILSREEEREKYDDGKLMTREQQREKERVNLKTRFDIRNAERQERLGIQSGKKEVRHY